MEQNRLLNGKGLFFYLLRCANGKALIYVYRLRKLICHLQQKQVQAFLQEQGYDQLTVAPCLRRLREHLQKNEFPHEIGVFLGYPLGDIRGFMEHRGANCKCTGHWKVYTDIASAQRTFDRYQRCTNCYLQRYLQGFDITQLTLVG